MAIISAINNGFIDQIKSISTVNFFSPEQYALVFLFFSLKNMKILIDLQSNFLFQLIKR